MAPLTTAAVAALLALSLSLSAAAAEAPVPTITAAPTSAKALVARASSASALPLTQMTYSYSDIPYQVNPYEYLRGPQTGYNICNSTTAGDNSECQTSIFNNISDFCLWGSPTANGEIGDVEAAVVAYCTKDTHGARTIRAGALQGVQMVRTSAYIQIVGFIDQAAIGLTADDSGGELDPHGADLLGNPLGGLMYSNGLPSGDNSTLIQAIEWNEFVGGNYFCLKLCDPKVTSPDYCQNIFDLLGCSYNMPSAVVNGTFTECDSDLQDEVATYTSDGKTYTWSQPSTLPATSTLPWTPRVPASSNCVTYKSEDLYSTASGSSSATTTPGSGKSTKASSSGAAKATGSVAASGPASSGATGLNGREVAVGLGWAGAVLAAVVGAAVLL